jgi:hypothetical protein
VKSKAPVILKLEGGLGNQLFQLAAGFFLAARLDLDLHVDQYLIPLTTAHGETGSGFGPFEQFKLPGSGEVLLLPSLPNRFVAKFAKRSLFTKRLLMKFHFYRSNPNRLEIFIENNDNESTLAFFRIDNTVKLHGNFQSWEIVEKAAQYGFPKVLKLEQTPLWVIELEKTIDFKNSIVLHFRVGDDSKTNHNFKQPEIEYYVQALKIIMAKKNSCGTYILSDDIPRVREKLGARLGMDVKYLEMPVESSPAERLYVMSLFGGIVCANSTFCGWAAWSIYNSGGEVVVPFPYSDGPVLGSRDFPPNWHKLDKYSGTRVN